jgi:hypothetical protein
MKLNELNEFFGENLTLEEIEEENKLKTLKDLKKYLPEDPYCMMDTLIDPTDKRKLNSKYYKKIREKYDKCGFISQSDLKQSAIEDIEELEKREKSLHIQGQIDYIKWKFNLR